MIYAGEIWKHSFISTVRPTDHTNPSQKRSFSKTIFKPEEFENETLSFRFRVEEKHFDNGAFLKQCRWMRFQIETSMFKFLRHGVDGEQKDNFSLSWRLPFPFLFFTVLIAYVTSHLDIVPFTKMKRKTSISPMLSDDVHSTKNKVLGPVV